MLDLTVVNGPGAAVALNEGCGAEFCQKERLPPRSFESAEAAPGRLCSLDGDADRLVYCYWRGKEWRLLDGDKIAALLDSLTKCGVKDSHTRERESARARKGGTW